MRSLRERLEKHVIRRSDLELAKKKLPTQEGFFFGSTEYHNLYWEDLELTVTQLDKVLNDPVLEDNN